MSNADQLPPEVLKALEISGASGVLALRGISGLGLYEAKLVIDAYLQKHPEHPISKQIQADAQNKKLKDGLPGWGEIVTADPVAGEAVAFETLAKKVGAPNCYVLMRESFNGESWLGEAIKACKSVMLDLDAVHIVDEEWRSKDGDISAVVIKLSRELSRDVIQALTEELRLCLPQNVCFRLVKGIQWNEVAIRPDDVTVEYFLHEFSTRGRMVWPTTSCVKLIHRPTGTISRSTTHRRRADNYEEALLLLASLLRESQ